MESANNPNDRSAAVTERMTQVKHKIIVLSGKGGVGKSTVAVNLATALALEGKTVGLLDIDLHGPTVPQLLGLHDQPVMTEGETLLPVEIGENLKIMSIGFLTGERDAAVVWRGPMKAIAIQQFLGDVEWGELDYLVIDSPPGTGDEPLAVCQAIGVMDGAVVVTTPQETAVANVRRSIKFCELIGLNVLGVVENMAGFVCPKCGEVTHVFSKGGGKNMAEKVGVPLLASVPLDPAIVEAGDSGKPYVYHYSKSTAAKEFVKALGPILALEDADTEVKSKKKGDTSKQGGQAGGSTSGPVMHFAIPTSDGILCAHFGHCEEFTLVDVDTTTKRVLTTAKIPAPPHEPGKLPEWLAAKGADAIIAGGMGSRAQALFTEHNIKVITGAPALDPVEVVEHYLADTLVIGENACDH